MFVLIVIKGYALARPFQTYLPGSVAAVYAAADTLAAKVIPHHSVTAAFTPTVDWYTAGGTQNGYDQGQVVVAISAAQSALLEVSGNYTLLVEVTPASDPTNTYPALRIPLRVDPVAFP